MYSNSCYAVYLHKFSCFLVHAMKQPVIWKVAYCFVPLCIEDECCLLCEHLVCVYLLPPNERIINWFSLEACLQSFLRCVSRPQPVDPNVSLRSTSHLMWNKYRWTSSVYLIANDWSSENLRPGCLFCTQKRHLSARCVKLPTFGSVDGQTTNWATLDRGLCVSRITILMYYIIELYFLELLSFVAWQIK
jgi:hypothetical protein